MPQAQTQVPWSKYQDGPWKKYQKQPADADAPPSSDATNQTPPTGEPGFLSKAWSALTSSIVGPGAEMEPGAARASTAFLSPQARAKTEAVKTATPAEGPAKAVGD